MSVATRSTHTFGSPPLETRARTWVVVPTYNERENINPFVDELLTALPDAHVLVVDDNSPDGTGDLAEDLSRDDPRVAVRHRISKSGLGAAYRDGFRRVLNEPGCERVVQMDCDFSHDPRDVGRLLDKLDDGYDVVIGSRYVRGGGTPGWGLKRRVISVAGSVVARSLLRLSYRDLTGGFKAWSAATLSALDLDAGYAQGYGFQIEMTYRAHARGARITEVPITFRDRTAGSSKMTAGIAWEALMAVVRLRLADDRRLTRLRALRSAGAPRRQDDPR